MAPKRSFTEHLKRVTKDENGCWLWPGYVESNGYGRSNKRWAHRVSYEHHFGPIADGQVVCHRCDVRRCVNPEHLFVGTIADNQRDMKVKGRASRGERSSSAKLTEAIVRSIRQDKRPGWLIAKAHGVSQTTISEIRHRKVWQHVA